MARWFINLNCESGHSIDVQKLVHRMEGLSELVSVEAEDHWLARRRRLMTSIDEIEQDGFDFTKREHFLREIERDHELYGPGVDLRIELTLGASVAGYVLENCVRFVSGDESATTESFAPLVEILQSLNVGPVEFEALPESSL